MPVSIDYDPLAQGIRIDYSYGDHHREMESTNRIVQEGIREYSERVAYEISNRIRERVQQEIMFNLPNLLERSRTGADHRERGRMTASEVHARHEEYSGLYRSHYGESYAQGMLDAAERARQLMSESIGLRPSTPDTPPTDLNQDTIKWMKNITKEIKQGHCTAKLLDTTQKIWDEGQNMRHCLGNTYMQKLKDARYIAYHIDVPKDICGSGITVGFKRGIGNAWVFDMAKGKTNRTYKDKRLDRIYKKIEEEINKNRKQSNKKKFLTFK